MNEELAGPDVVPSVAVIVVDSAFLRIVAREVVDLPLVKFTEVV